MAAGIDVKNNQLIIGLREGRPDDAATLSAEFGVPVATREEPVHQLDACNSRIDCPDAKGRAFKMYETINTAKICTIGFVVKRQGTSNLRVLTAGHCIEKSDGGLGSGWSHHGSQFGVAEAETWGVESPADAGLVTITSLSSAKNLLYASANYDVRSITSYVSNAGQNQGDFVCRAGKTTRISLRQHRD